MTFRADPGEVRRALPEDNRTNRRSHAFRCQVFSQIYLLDQGPTVGFQVKPNVQEHFSRDGEDWQEGSLLELDKAICIIWPNIFCIIWPNIFCIIWLIWFCMKWPNICTVHSVVWSLYEVFKEWYFHSKDDINASSFTDIFDVVDVCSRHGSFLMTRLMANLPYY